MKKETDWKAKLKEYVKTHKLRGIRQFRPYQLDIIKQVERRRDTLAILPTGAGKSLCFNLPAWVYRQRQLTLVIQPLISLMKAQVGNNDKGVAYLNSILKPEERKKVLERIAKGSIYRLHVAPERFSNVRFMNALRRSPKPLGLVVIDEAHCVSAWGHTFRPDYLLVGDSLDKLGNPPVLLLTATASPFERRKIIEDLGLDISHRDRIVGDFDRPNLFLQVEEITGKAESSNGKDYLPDFKKTAVLKSVLTRIKQRTSQKKQRFHGIIYAAYAKGDTASHNGKRRRAMNVETICQQLQAWGYKAECYHGQMLPEKKSKVQEGFTKGEIDIIVATNAFGMGIDVPDIRFVIHFDHPPNIEAYFQEIGRGGRDGKRCDCVLLYSPHDYDWKLESLMLGVLPRKDTIMQTIADLRAGRKRGPKPKREKLFDSQKQRFILPIAPVKYGAFAGQFSKLRTIGLAEQLPNVKKGDTYYVAFRLKKRQLSEDDWERYEDYRAERLEDMARGIRMVRLYAETNGCRRDVALAYFDSVRITHKPCCDNCQK